MATVVDTEVERNDAVPCYGSCFVYIVLHKLTNELE